MKSLAAVSSFTAILLLAVACGGGETATPTPTPSPTPSPTPVPPTTEETNVPEATVTALGPGPDSEVVFTRSGQLWVVNADTGEERMLAATGGYVGGRRWKGSSDPLLSSSGNVAFLGTDGNAWMVRIDGSGLSRLSSEVAPGDDQHCSIYVSLAGWSPDGSKFAYFIRSDGDTCTPPPGTDRLIVVDLNSNDRFDLVEINFIEWLDDQRIIRIEEDVPNRTAEWYAVEIDSGATSLLASFPCLQGQESFSASREKIAYGSGDPDGLCSSELIVADGDNTNRRSIISGDWADYQSPVLSPAGDRLVYTHQIALGGGTVTFDLRFRDIDSGEDRSISSGIVRPKKWLDNNRVVVSITPPTAGLFSASTLAVIDVQTGQLITIASDVDR